MTDGLRCRGPIGTTVLLDHRRTLRTRAGLLRAAVAAGLLSCALVGGVAHAAPQGGSGSKPPPTEAERKEAKQFFDAGATYYTQGQYEQAIESWEKAYEKSEEPLIFESIANAYERLGEFEKAREHLKLWRDAAPPNEHPTLDARLKALDERIAKKKQDQAKLAKENAKKAEKQKKKPTLKQSSSISIPGLIITGVGVVAVGGGIVVGAVASGQRPEESEVCREFEDRSLCLGSAQEDIDSSSTLAVVSDLLWIGGAVTATVGIVLLATHDPTSKVGSVTLRPSVGVGHGGLMLEGAF